jgi:hypothetical protein
MSAGSSVLSGAATGATIGSVVPGVGTVVGAGVGALVGLAPSVFKWFKGSSQQKKADAINPVNPGFVANPGALQNRDLINNIYNNYTLPGMSAIKNNLDSSSAGAYGAASEGATTGGDLLAATGQINANENAAVSQLGIQQAQQKQALVPQVMAANTAAGDQTTAENEFNYKQYLLQLQQKDAYQRAADANKYSAVDDAASTTGSMASSLSQYYAAKQGMKSGANSAITALGSVFA